MKRVAIAIILFLTAGAIVNIAGAWICAILTDRDRARAMHLGIHIEPSGLDWRVNAVVAFGTTSVLSQASFRTYELAPPMDVDPSVKQYTMPAEDALPWWCPWLRPDGGMLPPDWHSQRAFAYGLPVRSMMYVIDELGPEAHGPQPWHVHGIPNWIRGRHRGMTPTWPVALPLQPIWSGFAVNTIFYAAILWLFVVAPLAIRRHSRIKHGLCTRCGYNLRGNSTSPTTHDHCPECGTVVAPDLIESQGRWDDRRPRGTAR